MAYLRINALSSSSLAIAAALFLSATTGSLATPQSGELPDAASVQFLLRDGQWIDGRVDALDATRCMVARADAGVQAKPSEIARSMIVACLVNAERRRSMEFLTQLGSGTLVFSDGQFLPGVLRTDARPPRWEHRWVGTIPIKTDVLSEMRLVATRRAPSRPDADTILFLNGDIAAGFVESIGDEVVLESTAPESEPSEQPDKPAAEPPAIRRIQADRIAAITFAALGQPPSSDPLVWTVDGSIVRAKDLTFQTDSGWRFFLADPDLVLGNQTKPITDAVTKPTAILFDRSALTPLAACGQPECRPTESSYRYETRPQVRIDAPDQSLLGLGSIEFDGPVSARFQLPASMIDAGGTVAFSAEVALIEPIPLDARAAVVIRFSGTAGETVVLDAANRRATIRTLQPLSKDSALEIVVDDGGNGIAGDRVAIRRGCFIRQP
ncbi:MAG: hypothetical protein RLY21_1584 [Planctomycetota bacterium]